MQFYHRTLALLLVAAMAAGGCSSSSTPRATATTSVGEPEPEVDADPADSTEPAGDIALTVGVPFGVVQLAALDGVDSAIGLALLADVTSRSIANPDELRTGFAGGELDAAVMPTNVAANLFTRGVDVRLVGIVDAQLLHLLGPEGTTWNDLDGATVHMPFQGDVADLMFRRLAQTNGIVPDQDFSIQYGTALPDLVAAAAAGAVTHVVLPEHFATAAALQANSAGHDLTPIIDLQTAWAEQSGGDRLPQVALIVSGELADSEPALVAELSELVATNVRHVAGGETAALVDALGLPAPLVGTVVQELALQYRATPAARADLDLFLQALMEASPDSLGGSVPSDAFFFAE